jgi:Protein of unknown function (DUF3037)
MSIPYTFSVLRYVHDVVAGEFANVGVALYAPEERFLGAVCATTYGRFSSFFGGIDGPHIRRLLRHIQSGIEELADRLQSELSLADQPADISGWTAQVLPPDDSSLQFGPILGGFASDPKATLDGLYERFVERYSQTTMHPTRSDEDVLKVFRQTLAERRLLVHLHPKRIVGNDYEHEFPLAWKNGIWHASEAVSFDLADSGDILEKANRWLGRAVNLKESQEDFKLHLLLGAPRNEKLLPAFARAKNILRKMPVQHDVIGEENVAAFADLIAKDLMDHSEARHP